MFQDASYWAPLFRLDSTCFTGHHLRLNGTLPGYYVIHSKIIQGPFVSLDSLNPLAVVYDSDEDHDVFDLVEVGANPPVDSDHEAQRFLGMLKFEEASNLAIKSSSIDASFQIQTICYR